MKKNRRHSRQGEAGVSMIELILAMTVLVIGVLGSMIMITTSISTNSRNKLDTTAVNVAQLVMEKITAAPATSSPTLTVTDCEGTDWNINTAVGGATVSSGQIDFTAEDYATLLGTEYAMRYAVCGNVDGQVVNYEVRWSVAQAGAWAKVVTVTARPAAAESYGEGSLFNFPVTLRSVAGS